MSESSLIEYYRDGYDLLEISYHLMGMLLNDALIKRRINELSIDECYIYGGGFLGIQCWRSLKDYIQIKAFVDRHGSLKFDIGDVKVMDIAGLRRSYAGEIVIITPVEFAKEIYKELSEFIDQKRLIFLGEFVQGDV